MVYKYFDLCNLLTSKWTKLNQDPILVRVPLVVFLQKKNFSHTKIIMLVHLCIGWTRGWEGT